MEAKKSKIPIRNIYFILSYAWKYFYLTDKKSLELDNYENTLEFFSNIFESSLSRYIKGGLTRDYIEFNEEITSIKGKIDFNSSINKFTLRNKKLYCSFDDYVSNNIVNQIIKRTIIILLKSNIDKVLKLSLKRNLDYFHDVDISVLDKSAFSKVNIAKHDKHLKFLMTICYYIYNSLSFDDAEGKNILSDFNVENKKFGKVFENFILNFYKKMLKPKGYKVYGGERIKWDLSHDNKYYPDMITDIIVQKNNKKIIIDAKFYGEIYKSRYNSKKFISGHLYQVYSYLNNYTSQNKDEEIRGMLLYAANDDQLIRNKSIVSGKELFINNLNLNNDWQEIEEELLEIISESFKL